MFAEEKELARTVESRERKVSLSDAHHQANVKSSHPVVGASKSAGILKSDSIPCLRETGVRWSNGVIHETYRPM